MTSGIDACQSIRNKETSLTLEAQYFSSTISFQFSIRSTCLSQFYFVCVHMNHLGFEILIPFSISVGMCRITHLLCAIAFDSRLLIFVILHCAFVITCTSMDGRTSASTTFSFPVFVCTICASTYCCFATLSSFESSMNIGSTDVALHPICYLICQFLLLC